jgi:hypothetical protein
MRVLVLFEVLAINSRLSFPKGLRAFNPLIINNNRNAKLMKKNVSVRQIEHVRALSPVKNS